MSGDGVAWPKRKRRYVGAADVEDDDIPFAERFAALSKALDAQFDEGERLSALIREKLALART